MTGIYKNWTTGVQVFVQGIETQTCNKKNELGIVTQEKLKHVIYYREDAPRWRCAKPLYVFSRTYLKIS